MQFKLPVQWQFYEKKNFKDGVEDIIKEGNGTPLQYSCLENPTDRGAW